MSNIAQFRLTKNPSRQQALQWLREHYGNFPRSFGINKVGPELFHGWRFILGHDGIVYFANCVDRGITESELVPDKASA